MKRFLWTLTAVSAMLFAGCDFIDDPEGDDEDSALVGTTWLCSPFEMVGSNYHIDIALTFHDGGIVNWTDIYNYGDGTKSYDYYDGTYTYEAPHIHLEIDDDGDILYLEGEVNGNEMILYDEGEFYGIFIRENDDEFVTPSPEEPDDNPKDAALRRIFGGWVCDDTMYIDDGRSYTMSYFFDDYYSVVETLTVSDGTTVEVTGSYSYDGETELYMKFTSAGDYQRTATVDGDAMDVYDDDGVLIGRFIHRTR